MQKTRGTALLAASLLVMGGLSACGDEGSGTDESSSTTASPSAPEKESSLEAPEESSTSEASDSSESSESGGDDEVAELPAAAKKQTKAGAIAFNEFYFHHSGEALHSGETESLESFSDGCGVCDSFAEGIQADAKKGINMDRNPYVVDGASARKRSDGGYRVELQLNVAKYHEVLEDGSKGRTADSTSMTVVTDTQWTDGAWTIRDQVRVQ